MERRDKNARRMKEHLKNLSVERGEKKKNRYGAFKKRSTETYCLNKTKQNENKKKPEIKTEICLNSGSWSYNQNIAFD